MTSLVPPGDIDPLLLPEQLAVERQHDETVERTDPFWRRFVRDKVAMGSLLFLLFLIVVAVFAPLVAPYGPNAQDLLRINAGPSAAHWFGTDDLGRDILSRLIWGARISLRASFEIVGLAIVVALPLGLAAGFFRGAFDSILMRLMDALFSFPPLVLALTVAALLGPNLNDAAIAIAIVFVPGFVRLIRGEVISVREETYVESSHSLGASPTRMIRSHIFPNVASPIIIQMALALGFALLAEAGLSFLGVGEQPPTASWGTMLSEAYQFIFNDPLSLIFPGLAIMFTVLAFNLVADGMREAFGRQESRSTGVIRRIRQAIQRRRSSVDAPSPKRVVEVLSSAPVRDSIDPFALLQVKNLRVEFGVKGKWAPAVDGVSFGVRPGQTLGLVGESGSGKTVTALTIMGLLPAGAKRSSGAIAFNGRQLTSMPESDLRKVRGNEMAMIFQEPMTSLNPAYSVGNQIAEQVRVHKGISRAAAWKIAVECLDRVEIPNAAARAKQFPHHFSGGMRQRVMIAMALSCQPKLLIADEPTTALDVTTQAQIIELLRQLLDEQQMSMIFVTHDLGVIADVADEVVVMYAGQVVEQASVDSLFGRPGHPYTEALLESMPQMTPRGEPLHSIPGMVPRPDQFGEGCRFHARCNYAEARCSTTTVELIPRPAGSSSGIIESSRCLRMNEVMLTKTSPAVPAPATVALAAAPSSAPVALTVKGLSKEFPIRSGLMRRVHGSVRAVNNVDLQITAGTTLGLVGESGSGKSTLARLIMRLVEPTAGTVEINGVDLTALSGSKLRAQRNLMQMVFQDPYSSLDPRHTISSVVGEPLRIHTNISRADHDEKVRSLLSQVGLPSSAINRYPHQFSGGQRQRIAIARALAVSPSLLVCDEAVSALDVSTQAQVINLLRDLQQELGTSYLFIAHDLSVVHHISDRIAVMYLGEVVEEGPAAQVYARPAHPYTAALLSAIPVPDPVGRRSRQRVVLRGEVGDASNISSGCPFRTRCAHAMEICATENPAPFTTPTGVTVNCHLHTLGPRLAGASVLDLKPPASNGQVVSAIGAATS